MTPIMPPPDESKPPFESRVPDLQLPEGGFKSNLPEHLLEGVDPQTLYIMTELSKAAQANDFACHGVVELSKHLRTLNGKTYKTADSLAETKIEVEALNKKATTLEPIIKPISFFMGLWDYTAFRWVCYAAVFFFFTYLLPYYIQHPISLETLFNHLFGP